MALLKKDQLNSLPDFDDVNLTYQRIFDESWVSDSDGIAYQELSVEQLWFIKNMHRMALTAARNRCFDLAFERVDNDGAGMYDYCDGHAYYWPQFMAQLLDNQLPRRNKSSYFEELNSVLKENGYDPEPYCTTREGWYRTGD